MAKTKHFKITFANVIALYALILVAIPFTWWDSSLYLFGGDDIKLEYAYPLQKLKNILFTNLTSKGLSESALIHDFSSVPFLVVLSSIHFILPFTNLQLVISGIVMCCGFLGFYWMSGVLPGINKDDNLISKFIRFTTANLYLSLIHI